MSPSGRVGWWLLRPTLPFPASLAGSCALSVTLPLYCGLSLSTPACAEHTQDTVGPRTMKGSSVLLCKVSSDTLQVLHLILKLDFSLFKSHSQLAQFHLLIQKGERGFEKAYNKGS